MNDQTTVDDTGAEVLDPRKALAEQTLAVDLARVELDQAIVTAHRYPRSIDTVVKKISTLACYNKDAAENCVYALPRGGKPIIGPSIGFASIVAQSWGNARVAAQITFIDRREKVVVAAGRFFDLETNVETIVPAQRRVVDKHGRLYSDDMIQVTGMAAASIAARNAVLRGVSRGLWYPIWLDALNIVRGDATTFAENKDKALRAFAQFGVTPVQVFMVLGLKGEVELTLEHLPTLRGMYAQLRDGSTSVEEMFDPRRMTGHAFETVENPLGSEEAVPKTAAAPAQAKAAAGPAQAAAADVDPTAGMGEAPVVAAAAPPAQAPAAVAQPASPAMAAAPAQQNAPAASAAAPAAVPAGGTVKLASTADLKTEDEYLAYWEEVCAAATSAQVLAAQWAKDRKVRERCGLVGAQFDEARAMKDRRVAELGKAP